MDHLSMLRHFLEQKNLKSQASKCQKLRKWQYFHGISQLVLPFWRCVTFFLKPRFEKILFKVTLRWRFYVVCGSFVFIQGWERAGLSDFSSPSAWMTGDDLTVVNSGQQGLTILITMKSCSDTIIVLALVLQMVLRCMLMLVALEHDECHVGSGDMIYPPNIWVT